MHAMVEQTIRNFSPLDRAINGFDDFLRTISGQSGSASRENPAAKTSSPRLLPSEKRHAAGLMRVNETGEVCAQALYHGQALTARLENVRQEMQIAAIEERDHLAWCQERLQQLDSHSSYLNLLWYCGSFCLGALAGLAGDKWSLGFVMETERQVMRHLQRHLQQLPESDEASRLILQQMLSDEAKHAETAEAAGGQELPGFIKQLMQLTSKLMTTSAYYV